MNYPAAVARCGCSGGMCTCQVQGGLGVSVSGTGSSTAPFVLTTGIDTAGGTTGQVLARSADGIYRPTAPATTAPGAIHTGVGLDGDGSVGDPLNVRICSYGQLKALCA